MQRWKELGPINIEDIIKFNNKEIQYNNLKIGKPNKAYNFDIYG